jgi:Viral BACON domain
METKRCQRCHKLLRVEAQVCSRCGGHAFMQVPVTRTRQTIKLTSRQDDEMPFPSNPPASPHRAGHYSGLHPEDQPYQSSFLPVQRPPASTPYTIVQEPREYSPVMAEDEDAFLLPGTTDNGRPGRDASAQPVEAADYATIPEPEFFDMPAAKRRVATFTPLPQPGQQRSPLAYPVPQVQPSTPVSPPENTALYYPTSPPPPVREPEPLTLRPARRRRGFRGGAVPVLLALSCFLFLVATSILAFLLFTNKSTPALTPKLIATPSESLGVGDTVLISGSGFPANAVLRFTRDDKLPIKDQNGKQLEVQAYSTGNFPSQQITITRDWLPGPHTIFVSDQQNNTASKTITIIGSTSKPPQLKLAANSIDMGADSSGAITLKDLTLTNTGGGQVHWKASSDKTWLSANPANGTFSGSEDVKVIVNRGTLAALSYTGHLTFTELDDQQALPLVLTVKMTTNPSPPTATAANLALSSAALSFNGTPAQNPAGQAMTLQNTGGQPLNWTASAATTGGGNWLAVSPASGSLSAGGQQGITVSVVTVGLGVGTYSGTLTFSYGAASPSVAVSLVVAPPPMPALAVQPGTLLFNAIQGQNPPTQSFAISNPGHAPLDWGISEDANGAAYAQLSATSGTLPAGKSVTITVSPSIAQLSASTVKALITVKDTDPGATIKSQQVAVTFVIVNQAVIGLNATQQQFNHTSSIQMSSQLLILTDTGSAPLNWALTITNSSPVQWLTVDNMGGSLSPGIISFINVTCDSTNLSPGTYTATLQIYDTDAGTPVTPQTVTVTLVVS